MSAIEVGVGGYTRRSSAPRARVAEPVAEATDEALVASVGRGDEHALASLYDRHGASANGLARRVLRDRALAEDAVQEAFLTVWRTAGRFSADRGSARSWILMLVHRRAVDVLRAEARRRRPEPEPERESALRPSAHDEAWRHELRTQVQRALAALPDAQRQALELAYYGGLTQSELAERLGEPLGTVKSRIFTGLARLRDLLADADVADPRPRAGRSYASRPSR
jgi:RNA polymerase sigma-70 factor (ECF subfamily)